MRSIRMSHGSHIIASNHTHSYPTLPHNSHQRQQNVTNDFRRTTHLYVCHDSFMCNMTHPHARHIPTPLPTAQQLALLSAPWRIHMCGMTRPHTCRILTPPRRTTGATTSAMCAMTRSHEWHDSFTSVTQILTPPRRKTRASASNIRQKTVQGRLIQIHTVEFPKESAHDCIDCVKWH